MTLKFIKAKFNSKCAETGAFIPKGNNCYYDPAAKKVYALDSKAADNFMNGVSDPDEKAANEERSVAAYINAQEEAYWDNLTGGYYNS